MLTKGQSDSERYNKSSDVMMYTLNVNLNKDAYLINLSL